VIAALFMAIWQIFTSAREQPDGAWS
jgi:hypothetical protein